MDQKNRPNQTDLDQTAGCSCTPVWMDEQLTTEPVLTSCNCLKKRYAFNKAARAVIICDQHLVRINILHTELFSMCLHVCWAS